MIVEKLLHILFMLGMSIEKQYRRQMGNTTLNKLSGKFATPKAQYVGNRVQLAIVR
jgi:hypothetical protein